MGERTGLRAIGDAFARLRGTGPGRASAAAAGIALVASLGASLIVLGAGNAPPTARADGDPASDILLFAEPGEAISHVAIFVGSGRIIHASSAAGEVSYLDLGGSRGAWYVQNLVAVRRLL